MLHTDEYCWEADVAKNWRPGHRAWVHYTSEDGCFLGYRERRPRKGVCLDTPCLVGMAILDYAKCRMLDFHYNCMKKICKPLLLYTDTDSLMYRPRS